MKIKKGCSLYDVRGRKVIVNEEQENDSSNRLIYLNETAEFLWQEAERQQTFDVASLTNALLAEYDVDTETAQTSVERTLNEWLQIGIILS
ncbi:MAG: PqqD family protein [Bacteroidaceae bacterium]|nr:PqqD family protein [Bacteroidaceae bacterium]